MRAVEANHTVAPVHDLLTVCTRQALEANILRIPAMLFTWILRHRLQVKQCKAFCLALLLLYRRSSCEAHFDDGWLLGSCHSPVAGLGR
jgi:hypothetical protein